MVIFRQGNLAGNGWEFTSKHITVVQVCRFVFFCNDSITMLLVLRVVTSLLVMGLSLIVYCIGQRPVSIPRLDLGMLILM